MPELPIDMFAIRFIIAFIAMYYAASIVQTLSHRAFGHRRAIKAVFRPHALGPHAIYKKSTLLLDHWIPAEKHVMWYFVPIFLPLISGVFLLAPIQIFLGSSIGLAFAVWWHVFLHKHYHLQGSFFERFHWFRIKRELHFIHHKNVRTNYAIVEFWLDRLMGTIRVDHCRMDQSS